MFKILMLSGAVLFMSMTVQADDTVETCASGAGIVVTGKSGHKYCKKWLNELLEFLHMV